jgi:hypothetical protein
MPFAISAPAKTTQPAVAVLREDAFEVVFTGHRRLIWLDFIYLS